MDDNGAERGTVRDKVEKGGNAEMSIEAMVVDNYRAADTCLFQTVIVAVAVQCPSLCS